MKKQNDLTYWEQNYLTYWEQNYQALYRPILKTLNVIKIVAVNQSVATIADLCGAGAESTDLHHIVPKLETYKFSLPCVEAVLMKVQRSYNFTAPFVAPLRRQRNIASWLYNIKSE
jgi:hypothetical protein